MKKKGLKKHIMGAALALLVVMNASALAVTQEEAEQAAWAYVPQGAQLHGIQRDDGMLEVTFISGEEVIEVTVEPQSGQVLKLEGDVRGARGGEKAALDEAGVAAAVEAVYPGAQILYTREHRDDGGFEIEVAIAAGNLYGTLELNAQTGALIERKMIPGSYDAQSGLTKEAAQGVLLTLKPGVEIVEIELEEEDGLLVWEGEARFDGKRYEFEMDARSGSLIKWERD